MILQALCEYYHRKEGELPAFGFEEKGIPFVIVIDENGRFINLQHNVIIEGNKQITEPIRVPKAKGRSGGKSYEVANILWDHYGYIVAQPKLSKPDAEPTEKDITMANNQNLSFKRLVKQILKDIPNDKGVIAVNNFLQSAEEIEKLKSHNLWKDCIKKPGTNLSFKLANETYWVCQSPQVIEWVKNQDGSTKDAEQGVCLITGEQSEISRLHDNISGVAQKPAPLASINDKAYNSYGKDKGFNFPVGRKSAFQYTTAINHLLRKNSPAKFRIGATSYMCWSEKENLLERTFTSIFTENPDDPEKGTREIKNLFNSIHNGAYTERDGTTQFYVLGLTPNSARVAVSYWKKGTVKEFAENIAQWFGDLLIVGQDHYGYPSLKKLLRHTALQYKDDNVPPNLAPSVIRAILTNTMLPETFLQATIRRIKAELGKVDYYRVCTIKACINRKNRIQKPNQRKLTMYLNKEEKRIGYCLGRLFAVLEKLQQDSHPGINATIGDRYYSSASCTPKSVFGTLMRLSKHHLKKLEKPSWKINAEKRIGEIFSLIPEFPSHLNLENQGLFAIGYYHQKQDFYTKSTKTGEEE